MKTSMRRFLAASTVAAMAAAGTVTMTTGADATSAAAAKKQTTNYVFSGYSYGAAANTGFVGVASGPVANSVVGCTRRVNRKDANRVADAALKNLLNVGAVTSNNRSYRKGARVGMLSTNKVAAVTIGDPNGVRLEITGLSTRANAFATRKGKLKAKATFNAADIKARTGTPLDDILDGVANPLNKLLKEIQKNAGNLELPGIGLLQLGERTERATKKHARARATSLVVKLYGPDAKLGGGDDVRVRIGRASARIAKDVPSGVMNGRGRAISGSLLNGAVKVGPLGNKSLQCEGTGGKIQSNSVTGINLLNANALKVNAGQARVFGKQLSKGRVRAWTEGRVANVELNAGGTGIKINGIVGRANVNRTAKGKFKRNIKGTKVAEIVIGGKKIKLPKPGKAIQIPGVVKIQFAAKKKTKNSMEVAALRITLLDGSVGTLELGKAKVKVRKG